MSARIFQSRFLKLFPFAIVICLLCVGCSTVPKEVVELSYRMGQDIQAIHNSYKALVHAHFEALRAERIRYLEDEWIPKYLQTWIRNGRLIEVAKGEIVWAETKEDFVPPTPSTADIELLSTIEDWSATAIQDIDDKKSRLIAPIDLQEQQLSSWVDDAFNRLYRGNAAITAHLNSLRKVQEVQDEALAALHCKDLRDKINDTLINASVLAKKELEEVRKTDGLAQEAKQLLPRILKAN